MNRFILPLLAMAFTTPVAAQSSLPSSEGGWAGAHFGVQLGLPLSSEVTFDSAPGFESELDGVFGGAQIGFRRQTNAFVYGGEAAFLVSEPTLEQEGTVGVDVRVTTTRLGAQAGYDLGRFLPYGTLGVARMTFQDTVGFGDTSSFGTFAGVGFEYQLGDTTSVGLQAVRENFENFNEGADINVTQTNVSVQFNIRY